MDLNRYKLDNTYVRAILLLWADGVPWPSGARDRVPGAPTQARFSQLGSRHSVADGHAVLPIAPMLGHQVIFGPLQRLLGCFHTPVGNHSDTVARIVT